MKIRFTFFLAIICLSIFIQETIAQNSVSIRNYNTSFRIISQSDRFSKAPWAWTPAINLTLSQSVGDSAMLAIDYTLPDGKAWHTSECYIQGKSDKNPYVEECGEKTESKKGSILTGVFGFKVRLVDEVLGTNQTLMTGKFKIGKFLYNPGGEPEGKNQFHYYIDNDWRLPIGYVHKFFEDGDAKGISVDMAFKGLEAVNRSEFSGHLFYQGNQVISTKDPGGSVEMPIKEVAWERNPFEYYQYNFVVPIYFSPGQKNEYFKYHNVADNPGEYELKVLFKGKLVRTAKFTVGKDGNIVDNGIAQNANLGYPYTIIPVSVLGTIDGTWNKTAWQTETFWGNPIKGFTALP